MSETTQTYAPTKPPRVMRQPIKDELRRQLEVARAKLIVANHATEQAVVRMFIAGSMAFGVGFIVGFIAR